MGRRFCSSTVGRRTTSAGSSSTRARSSTSSDSSPIDLRGHGMSEAPLERGALHRSQALGRRRGGDHRRAGPRPAGARRLVVRGFRHLRLHPCVRAGACRGDQFRRGSGSARRGGLRHADRSRLSRPFRRCHRRRPAHEHRSHALIRPGLPRQTGVERRSRDGCVLERPRTGSPSAPISRPASSTTTTFYVPSRCRCSSRKAGPTGSCFRRWLSTCSPPAQPARRPGTTASVTFRTSRIPTASTASWPS